VQAEVVQRADRDELDELTLRRACRGEPRAFRALVEVYHLRVYHLVWRLVAARAGQGRVEELTQETFLRVHRALATFDPRGAAKLSTWILTIATRLSLNELRRAGRDVPLDDNALEAASAERPDHEVERRRTRQAVAAAVDALAPDHRAVLVLREYHDLSYEEIAAALGVDLGTVKSRLSRARAKLREALEEVGDDR
jgi:RNA polymerase sigma-70 factor (ECF subfamily)